MKKPPLHYTMRIKDPRDTYPQLEVAILQLSPEPHTDEWPLPVFHEHWNASGNVNLTWQCTRHDTPADTGKPYWYARKITWDGNQFSDTALLQRLARLCPAIHDPADLLAALDKDKAVHVAMSGQLGRYVHANRWETAENWRMYYDRGISDGGCTVNAYAWHGSTPDEITAAVASALRRSRHCSNEQLFQWVNAGSPWSPGNHEPREANRPATREQVLGRPVVAAAA